MSRGTISCSALGAGRFRGLGAASSALPCPASMQLPIRPLWTTRGPGGLSPTPLRLLRPPKLWRTDARARGSTSDNAGTRHAHGRSVTETEARMEIRAPAPKARKTPSLSIRRSCPAGARFCTRTRPLGLSPTPLRLLRHRRVFPPQPSDFPWAIDPRPLRRSNLVSYVPVVSSGAFRQ